MPDARIHVDFNGIQEDGRITALTRHADDPSAVRPGALVVLWDEDGNTAQGRVVEVGDRDLVHIDVLLDTWLTEEAASSLESDSGDGSLLLFDDVGLIVVAAGLVNCTFAGSSRESRTMRYVFSTRGFRAHQRTFETFYKVHSVNAKAPATSDS